MPQYKLHYFNGRGFAELSRLLFAAAGEDYEDVRYERETTWPEAKPSTKSTDMPKYRLHYFNARGGAELSRYIFAAAGHSYDDVRHERDKEWTNKVKPQMPFGSVPVLEIDGEMLAQSFAIAKYLAKTFNLYGSNPIEEARIDEVIEVTRDLMMDVIRMRFEQDEAKKAELQKLLNEEKLPRHFENLQKILKRNKDGDGFFIGDKLSVADLQVMNVLSWFEDEQLATVPLKLKAHRGRIQSIDKIADWIKKRPQTQF